MMSCVFGFLQCFYSVSAFRASWGCWLRVTSGLEIVWRGWESKRAWKKPFSHVWEVLVVGLGGFLPSVHT